MMATTPLIHSRASVSALRQRCLPVVSVLLVSLITTSILPMDGSANRAHMLRGIFKFSRMADEYTDSWRNSRLNETTTTRATTKKNGTVDLAASEPSLSGSPRKHKTKGWRIFTAFIRSPPPATRKCSSKSSTSTTRSTCVEEETASKRVIAEMTHRKWRSHGRWRPFAFIPVILMACILGFETVVARQSRRPSIGSNGNDGDVSPNSQRRNRNAAAKWVTLPTYRNFMYGVLVAYFLEFVLALFCASNFSDGQPIIASCAFWLRLSLVAGTAGFRVFLCGFVSLYLVQWEMGYAAFARSMFGSLFLGVVVVFSRCCYYFSSYRWAIVFIAGTDIFLTAVWIVICLYALLSSRKISGRFGVAFAVFMGYLIMQQILYILSEREEMMNRELGIDSSTTTSSGPTTIFMIRWLADGVYFLVFPFLLYFVLLSDSQFWRTIGDQIKGLGRRKESFLNFMPNATQAEIHGALRAQVPILDFTSLDQRHFAVASGATSRIFRTSYRGTPVVLKSYDLKPFTLETVLDFSKEAFLYCQLHHPNIVKFLGVCLSPPDFFIVFEYCNHKSLLHVLKSKSVDLSWATRLKVLFALDAARGMCFAHEQNILHRDLKTMNLLVHKSKSEYIVKVTHYYAKRRDILMTMVMVCDFGSSRLLMGNQCFHAFEQDVLPEDDDSMLTGVVGTIAYMAPELLQSLIKPRTGAAADAKRRPQRKLSMYGFAVDVFSFGYVMWEILTRKMPYHGMRSADIREAVLSNHRPNLPLSHPNLEVQKYAKLIERCWHMSPFERPVFAEIVRELEILYDSARDRQEKFTTIVVDSVYEKKQ